MIVCLLQGCIRTVSLYVIADCLIFRKETICLQRAAAVAFQEAATAAQSDAQSALNQDQVPRAYQGAVRDYFDDLKK